MKFRTTAKAIKEGYAKILTIGYCDMHGLLHYQNAMAYTAGVYGWNFDLYYIDGVAICTGYRGTPTGNIYYYNEIVREYELKARAINNDWGIPYEKKRAKVNRLLSSCLLDLQARTKNEELRKAKEAEARKPQTHHFRDFVGRYTITTHRNGTATVRHIGYKFKKTYKTYNGARIALAKYCDGMPEEVKEGAAV